MILRHLPYGRGDVKSPINYLLSLKNHKRKKRVKVKRLQGDSIQICQRCTGIKTLKKCTTNAIPSGKKGAPTQEEIAEILSDCEPVASAGLTPSSYTNLALLHIDEDGSWRVHIGIAK